MTKRVAEDTRFISKLWRDKNTGCLLYGGYANRSGHRLFRRKGSLTKMLAHRYAWLLAGNVITDEYPHVLHDCPCGDNPACCEPAHLWAGTNAENMLDKARKGQGTRSQRGLPFGVRPNGNGFQAQIQLQIARRTLGTYPTIAEAAEVACREKDRVLSAWWQEIVESGRAAAWRYGGK